MIERVEYSGSELISANEVKKIKDNIFKKKLQLKINYINELIVNSGDNNCILIYEVYDLENELFKAIVKELREKGYRINIIPTRKAIYHNSYKYKVYISWD